MRHLEWGPAIHPVSVDHGPPVFGMIGITIMSCSLAATALLVTGARRSRRCMRMPRRMCAEPTAEEPASTSHDKASSVDASEDGGIPARPTDAGRDVVIDNSRRGGEQAVAHTQPAVVMPLPYIRAYKTGARFIRL